MNGPFKVSPSDTRIFECGGLRDMIPPGHREIADGGYKSNAIVLQFRHGNDMFAIAFEAVCVIVQYQLDNGSPLFDT